MNIFALILGLVPGLVKGIEIVVGDKTSGATKSQMAHDALEAAVNAAAPVLTGSNAVYGQVAAAVAQTAIDQTVAISKASGVYQKWTAASKAATQDASIAQAVEGVIKAAQNPTPVPPTPATPATA